MSDQELIPGEHMNIQLAKIRKLTKQNKLLKQKVSCLHELLTSDKHQKELKYEVDNCVTECKKILNVLEDQVSKSIYQSMANSANKTIDGIDMNSSPIDLKRD